MMEYNSISTWDIHEPLSTFCKINTQNSLKLTKFLSKQMWSSSDREECLTTLSKLFMDGSCVVDICCLFSPFILDIASRAVKSVLKKDKRCIQKLAVSISEGLPVSEELKKFTVDLIKVHQPFFMNDCSSEPLAKRKKKSKIPDLEWCQAMYLYVNFLPQVAHYLDLSHLPEHLSSSDSLTRWYAASTLSKHLKMTEKETSMFLKKYFTPEEQKLLTISVTTKFLKLEKKGKYLSSLPCLNNTTEAMNFTQGAITSQDTSSDVVNVMGILLPKISGSVQLDMDWPVPSLVLVASTQQHLQSLALAVSIGQPVLLQGPVGCGKSSLVEHLATLTGRTGAPNFFKIQLGDQTDSKALLGTYCSTEVPGEFVWRAGVLTQAVLQGGWVLLEDIDMAPMDILSLLLALAETRTLTVPGHKDEVRAAPGFQLFTTVRLLNSSDGVYQQKGGNTAFLEKLCCIINVESLSREELNQVISTRFPTLAPISDKLLNIYFSLSASLHDHDWNNQQEDAKRKNLLPSLGGRLISTRDLMSWCRRSAEEFDLDGPMQGLKVFIEALDCFVSCVAKPSKRQSLAVAIGSWLNIPDERARYFNSEHKPSIKDQATFLEVGRGKLIKKRQSFGMKAKKRAPVFSYTRSSVSLLEKVSVCVRHNESVLLVGETGTGKTSTIQFLAHYLGHKLHVINLNQQSDSTDLLGGFKPVDFRTLVMPLREEFEGLFCETFSRAQNEKFLSHIQTLFSQKRWHNLLALMEAPIQKAFKKFISESQEYLKWTKVSRRIHELRLQLKEAENVLAFSFIEGTLVRALKNGDWVLLDEINLAAAETLDCLSGLLESGSGSVVLTERGDTQPIKRHPDFRLFACMNPATDVGKKDLPVGIRNRFTEFYVEELVCPKELATLVRDYLPGLSLSSKQIFGIVQFFISIKNDPSDKLKDGTGHKPHFSLRTLCRALQYSAKNCCGSVPRSLFEGFCLSFLTQLDRSSHPIVEKLISKHVLIGSSIKSIRGQKIPPPDGNVFSHVHVADYWISKGVLEPCVPSHYIITPSVKMNLKDLCRIVAAGNHPVLLQGETSVGKTSLITYLAQLTGNLCVRVNNHEHTDLQEYVGCYAADERGKLSFREGVLVEAMRKGHWIILDELNLAPSDVLEALNRLLDDNQELFIPETQEVVHAHPKFMLFATQNPPGLYGGRKVLSRAFRNRFIELHFDEIPSGELETILHERCGIPLSYAKKLVAVMLELQTRRSGSGIFFGKQGFMTLRDLFRWAQRYNCPETGKGEKFYDWDQHLADHGYMLLAGRVRKLEEEEVIKEVIAKHMKRQVSDEHLFNVSNKTSAPLSTLLNSVMSQNLPGFEHIVWTYNMRRLAVLIGQAVQFKEPVLLVGDTGIGKTTICQLLAAMARLDLHTVNCHMHSESADFLGGLRPVRSHDNEEVGERKLFEWKDGPLVQAMKDGSMFLIDEISLADDSVLERLNSVLEPERTLLLAERGGVGEGYRDTEVEKVVAHDQFHVFATMNPGGDFGKKELSPALRNRFTEIWCPQLMERKEMMGIIEKNILPGLQLFNTQDGSSGFGQAIIDFIQWFTNTEFGQRVTISIRDILTWVTFINTSHNKMHLPQWDTKSGGKTEGLQFLEDMRIILAYLHGACLVFIDSLGAGSSSLSLPTSTKSTRQVCLNFLLQQIFELTGSKLDAAETGLTLSLDVCMPVIFDINTLTIPPFSIERVSAEGSSSPEKFTLQAPTTCVNAQRVLRGLQLHRPILLEGSPGVGKTSLVSAIARLARRPLVRINLSEQTDVTDLFGADLPVEGEEGGHFAWRDGPFLQALKAGHWVVFDELNLASQSVLEGLNACLDHRGEVYIPELGKTFHIQFSSTRIFACQNPLSQGGGRKGLPRSFLNRFTQVFVEPLSEADLKFILVATYPGFPEIVLDVMVDFNSRIYAETMVGRTWGIKGSPWEFNLRDLFRWCELLKANQCLDNLNPGEYVGLVYCDRMRTEADKAKVLELYSYLHGDKFPPYQSSRHLHISTSRVQIGHSFLPRVSEHQVSPTESAVPGRCLVLHHCLESLESLAKCVEMGWLSILLGPQSCGKTSLVHLLAQLTGHRLCVLPMNSSMDTTELLGGFEQVDIWRHLGIVANLTELHVRHVELKSLVEGDLSDQAVVSSLEKALALYRQLPNSSEGLTSEDVIELLNQHVQHLKTIMLQLEKLRFHSSEMSLDLNHRLSQLCDQVSELSRGNGGGAFEWVDSILVKALQTGQWLLIDNVNFCSASVLDRLNALLEPGGVLNINELGTVNGEIVTVTPHPDFRLFFAMDPKRGEISRAMRNRGVEIYISGEEDKRPYSPYDLHALLTDIGLIHPLVRNKLLALHQQLQMTLPLMARPVVADLLQAGSICSQLQTRGFGIKLSMANAMEDVYVSSKTSFSLRKMVHGIVQEELSTWEDLSTEMTMDKGFSSCQGRFFCYAKETNALILEGLQQMQEDGCSNLQAQTQLCTMAAIFASQQSAQGWALATEWLMHAYQSLDLPDMLKNAVNDLHTLSKMSLQTIFCNQEWDRLGGYLHQVFQAVPSALSILEDAPWDLSFNPQASTRATVLHTTSLERLMTAGERDYLDKAQCSIQRLQLCHQCVILSFVLKDKLQGLEATLNTGKQKDQVKKFQRLVCLLISQLVSHLPHLVLGLPDDKVLWLHQNINNLKWVSRLIDVAATNAKTSTTIFHKEVFISHLALHWHWTMVKLAPIFNTDSNQFPKLDMAIEELSRHLGQGDLVSKNYVRFWTNFGHPKPHQTMEEADAALQLKKILKAISPDRSDTVTNWKAKVKMLMKWGSSVKKSVIFVQRSILEGKLDSAVSELKELISLLIQLGILKTDDVNPVDRLPKGDKTSEMDASSSTVGISRNVVLWPLFEHMSMKIGLALAANSFKKTGVNISGGRSEFGNTFEEISLQLQEFDFSHLPVPSKRVFSLHPGIDKERSLSFWNDCLASLWKSCASRDPQLFLDWMRNVEGDSTKRTDMGPGVLYNSPMMAFVMDIFSSDSRITSSELLPLHISLEGLELQLQQVALVSRHMWCHSATLASEQWDQSILMKQILIHSFLRLLDSIVIEEEDKSSWDSVISSLSLNTAPQAFGELLSLLCGKEDHFPPSTIALLTRCCEVMQDLWIELDQDCLQSKTGHGFAYVGLLLLQLVTPCGSVDPVEKAGIKKRHVLSEIEEIDWELSIWERFVFLTTGRSLGDTNTEHLHSRVVYLMSRRVNLVNSLDKLDKRCAYRPDQTQFGKLTQAVQNFSNNTCSISKVTDLVNKLTSKTSGLFSDSALLEEEVWQNTSERFLNQLEDNFPCYQDVLVPVSVAVLQIKLGLRLMAHSIKKTDLLEKMPFMKNSESVVKSLCQFPSINCMTPDLLSVASVRVSQMVQDAVHYAFHQSPLSNLSAVNGIKSKLWLSSLLTVKVHCFSIDQLDTHVMKCLFKVLDSFAIAWREQEEEKRQEEAERGALFKYKDEIHGDERSEKEIEEEEFLAAYPSFNQDFLDFTEEKSLEGIRKEVVAAEVVSSTPLAMLTNREMASVCDIHHSILVSLSQTDWLVGEKEADSAAVNRDAMIANLLAYKLGSQIVKNCFDVLGHQTDGSILGSHLLTGESVLHYLDESDQMQQSMIALKSPKGKSYNFYHDANVPEVMKCVPVLESLSTRVSELRQEWPDHPTLVLLHQLRDRILSFSVTSPVIKFLTGMELVLDKAQDWESNAASFVSMATQLTEITTIIVKWRKLELSCWNSSLEREEEQCREQASHWWFHLYHLVSDYLKGGLTTSTTDKGETVDVVSSLKSFVENSSLGEYSLRLDMLKAFHCQLFHMDSSPAQQSLLYSTWNLYQFYSQFLPVVQEELKKARTPIDKQLKGLVKIARWSDLNYWALKTSTEKTHRTVHKYMKQYQSILKQPVKNLLGEKGEDVFALEIDQMAGYCVEEKLTALNKDIFSLMNTKYIQDTTEGESSYLEELPLLCRLPQLCQRMKSHIRKSWKKMKHSNIVQTFDSFTGEIIEGIHELQKLEVNKNAEKEKQKTEAKRIDLRKRKGLSELFRYLTFIGLSYRKGVTGSRHQPAFSSALEQPPLDLGFNSQESIQNLWTGCTKYFYRCMIRHAHFIEVHGAPSKELGMADIQRCFGFSEHLSKLYLDHRRHLCSLATHTRQLRKKETILKMLSYLEEKSLPPQAPFKKWLVTLRDLLIQMSQGLGQFAMVMDACPSGNHTDNSIHPSPLPTSVLAASALWWRGDKAWTHCDSQIKIVQQLVKTQQTLVDNMVKKCIFERMDMLLISKSIKELKAITPVLFTTIELFTEPGSGLTSSLVSPLSYLASQINVLSSDFEIWFISYENRRSLIGELRHYDQETQEMVTDFKSAIHNFLEDLLVAVQNVSKLASKKEEEEQIKQANQKKENEREEEEEKDRDGFESEQPELEEHHLSNYLLKSMECLHRYLACDKIIEHLEKILTKLVAITEVKCVDMSKVSECISLLVKVKPLVSTYTLMTECHLGHAVVAHRSMGKLLSVLLAVFTELFQKGFCIPPEIADEMEGEGATEFKDIEGGGLGEGEGAKDVSDQIESEDQLEEAKKPGSEDKEDNFDDQPDIQDEDNGIEMADDFDGKLHSLDETEDVDEDEENERDKQEEELDKQMGDVDNDKTDKLDERMWGEDEEEEEEDENSQEKERKDEMGGGGMDKQKEEMVAKDNNKENAAEAQEEEEDGQHKEDKRDNQMDSDMEYDDNQVNPHEQPEATEAPDALDLPDDLDLDDQDSKEEKNEEMDFEENAKEDGEKSENESETDNREDETEDNIPQLEAGNEEEEEEDSGGKEEERQGTSEEEARAFEEEKGMEDSFKAEQPVEQTEEENKEDQEEESTSEPENPTSELQRDKEEEKKTTDKTETSDEAGPTNNETEKDDCNVQGEQMEQAVTNEEQNEKDAVGFSSSDQQEGHEGQESKQTTEAAQSKNKQSQRKPGESNQDRTLGSREKMHQKLKTKDSQKQNEGKDEEGDVEKETCNDTAEEYEHVKEAKGSWDAQAVDMATQEQLKENQAVPNKEEEEGGEIEEDAEVKLEEDDVNQEESKVSEKQSKKPSGKTDEEEAMEEGEEEDEDPGKNKSAMLVEGERVLTMTVQEAPQSTLHTVPENLHAGQESLPMDVETLRLELEGCVKMWSHTDSTMAMAASEAWQKYQAITNSLSQELCEQLRLLLEPSQATKLKGDFRTGKRLNMRKVIPYIASQFRKDKIWLRRSKPSKRQYQIMIAIDDSSSMADNHTKQLAFESLALVSNALTLLESGELAVCSFGEEFRLLHPFSECFTNLSGASILQQLSCEQNQTKYGLLLDKALALMQEAKMRQLNTVSSEDTAQLLLILSDGHGVFREGMDTVRKAVLRARAARIFLVFLVMDNPDMKGSILDSRVPIIDPDGQIGEIKTYLELFPFPFYIILRDINNMPHILSNALRQWFELVTTADR